MKTNYFFVLFLSLLYIGNVKSQCINCLDSVTLNKDLKLCLPFNGNANDESGRGHSGTVTGASLSVDRFGNSNNSYNFNGINNYITIPHSSDLSFGSDSTFSIAFWYKANSASSFSSIITKSEQSDTSGYAIGFDNVGRFRFIGNLMYEVKTSKALPLNTWQFYCMTFNTRNEIKIYVNGLLDTKGSIPNLRLNTRDVKLGRLYTNTTGYFFNGSIDDLRLYNRVLSGIEVANLNSCLGGITSTGFYEVESKETNRIIVYPNPLGGGSLNFEFSLGASEDIVIDFYDISGNKVYSFDQTGVDRKRSESIVIDNLNLNKGIYYIRILNGKELTNRLLIVD